MGTAYRRTIWGPGQMTKGFKANEISAIAKKDAVFICFVKCVWQPVLEGECSLQTDLAPECFLFVFSQNLEMQSLHRGEEQRECSRLYRDRIQVPVPVNIVASVPTD